MKYKKDTEKKHKSLKELTIKDNFMFSAVMVEEENCRDFLELVTGLPIEKVEVSKEKTLVYHPEYKGVRLDVYAKDENNTHYNVEMQVIPHDALEKCSRYYHSQIDMEILLKGEEYGDLPDTYVIFVCDFDPFGMKKYCYTFENVCLEDKELRLNEGCKSIFLSTKGKNEEEVPKELVHFLKYVEVGLEDSEKDFHDDFVAKLQKTVREVKYSREMEGLFMMLQEMLRDERKEGRAQGKVEGKLEGKAEDILAVLEDLGEVPDRIRDIIYEEEDLSVLTKMLKIAAKSDSIEEFEKAIQ